MKRTHSDRIYSNTLHISEEQIAAIDAYLKRLCKIKFPPVTLLYLPDDTPLYAFRVVDVNHSNLNNRAGNCTFFAKHGEVYLRFGTWVNNNDAATSPVYSVPIDNLTEPLAVLYFKLSYNT